MTIIAPRAARPQPRLSPDPAFVTFPDPAVSRCAWAMLLASWQHRQVELADAAAADTERKIDALLERKIKAARQRVVRARIHAEQAMAWSAMRLLIGGRMPEQVRRLEVERGLS